MGDRPAPCGTAGKGLCRRSPCSPSAKVGFLAAAAAAGTRQQGGAEGGCRLTRDLGLGRRTLGKWARARLKDPGLFHRRGKKSGMITVQAL